MSPTSGNQVDGLPLDCSEPDMRPDFFLTFSGKSDMCSSSDYGDNFWICYFPAAVNLAHQCRRIKTSGKPSTWLPLEGLVE